MTNAEIHKKITAVIDQFYRQNAPEYIQEAQLEYIGGVLHTALFLLPFELYNHKHTNNHEGPRMLDLLANA